MRDIISIAWVVIVVIGVVSSIVKSVKKAQQGAQSPVPGAQPPLVRTTGVPSGLHAQFAADASPLTPPVPVRSAPVAAAVPPPVRRPVRNPAPPVPQRGQVPQMPASVPDYVPPATAYAPAPLDNTPPPHAPVLQTRAVRAARLFGSPKAVLRSIIAAEVLGKPRALRDEY
jgi:soluble lytic murein transglycosylase-like protein